MKKVIQIGKESSKKVKADGEVFDPDVVKRIIESDLAGWEGQVDDLIEPGTSEPSLLIETLASEYGNEEDQAKELLDILNLEPSSDDQDDPEYWQWEIERAEDEFDSVADMLNDKIDLPGTIYFMWADGGYHMFYTWEIEDHPELME